MTSASGARQPRRPAPSGPAADRYRALARDARRRRVRQRSLAIVLGIWLGLAMLGTVILARAGTAADQALAELGAALTGSVTGAFPALTEPLGVDRSVGTVTSAPVIDDLPEFTKDPRLVLVAHLPSFANAPDRRLEVTLNGKSLGAGGTDAQGRFATPLALADGPNQVIVTLLDAAGRALTSTSGTVVLDRTPPVLALSRPSAGETLIGAVTVEGKSEPGAQVTVNGRVVFSSADGTFSDTFAAPPGRVAVTVVASDRAGNVTTSTVDVVVNPATSSAVALSLDRATVRPGEAVIAQVLARPGSTVTLQVNGTTVGTARVGSDASAKIGFTAPDREGSVPVVALGESGVARATLTVAP